MIPTTSLLAMLLAVPLVSTLPPQRVEWVYSMAEAKERAMTLGKDILVYCWADGSDFCGKLYQETLTDQRAGAAMGSFVCYSAKHGQDGVAELFERYGVSTLPTMLFLKADGTSEDLIQGFIPVDDFVHELERIEKGEGTVSGLRSRVEKSEAGSEEQVFALWSLAGKVQALGNQEEHDRLMDAVRQADPQGRTPTGATVFLGDLVLQASMAGDPEDAKTWDLQPLYAFAKSTKLDTARFDAWNRIGNLEVSRQDMQAAFAAFRIAFKTAPEEQVVEWCNDIARWVIEHAEDRTSKEKKFALEVVESAVQLLERKAREQEKAGVSGAAAAEIQDRLAYSLDTLAWVFHVNGKQREAVAAAKRCVALRDLEEYRKDLERFARGD